MIPQVHFSVVGGLEGRVVCALSRARLTHLTLDWTSFERLYGEPLRVGVCRSWLNL